MGFFSKSKSSKSSTGSASNASNVGSDVSGAGAISMNFQDNRQATGGSIGDSGMPDAINILQTDQGAIDAGLQIGLKGIESATFQTGKALDVTGELINATSRAHDNNLIFASDTIKKSLDTATDQFKFSQQQTQQGIDRAFAAADKITRSDSTITMDALAKYGAIAAVVIVGLQVWGKMQ
jgi:hypothetical protein